MPIPRGLQIQYLEKAVEIAKAAAGSGGQGCVAPDLLAQVIKKTYDQMVAIAETFNQ